MKQQQPTGEVRVEVNPDGIPERLKRRRQFVVWLEEYRAGKFTKVPHSSQDPRRGASSTDLMTWDTCEAALEVYESRGFDGIGFMFCSADPFTGIDLDGCRNPDTGIIDEWARDILQSFENPVLAEVSPSGEGIILL